MIRRWKAVHAGLDNSEARVAKLDGKSATPAPRDFDGVFARMRELDARCTALEGKAPNTVGSINGAARPNSGAAVSPEALPEDIGNSLCLLRRAGRGYYSYVGAHRVDS
jgi:hypothetical protein